MCSQALGVVRHSGMPHAIANERTSPLCEDVQMMEGDVVERLMTLRDAAATLSVSPDFLKRLHRAGRIRVVRLGRAVRVPEAEVERLVREGVTRAEAE